jgi:hypothetical protein
MNKSFTTNMNRNLTEVKKMMWLLLMELEKEVEDLKGNEMCMDKTLWNILYEMSATHEVLLCDCLFVFC